ncbi:hypothetical protein Fot_14424 [Forsythia ovata]|uniref:Uncharacterized protein n=1 Tax=Forsythia ovata TaxID=205694 RepID=A0ABD1W6A0_9LAMI
MTTDNSSYIPPVPETTSEVPSTLILARPVPSPRSARQSGKRKACTKSVEEAFRAPTSPPLGKYEYINIGSHWDELDPTVSGKLPSPAAKAAASVHKYWTSAFGKAADNAELTELLKLTEMYTSRSHVLNSELYKLLEMKVDELRSITGEMRMLKRCAQKIKIFRGDSYFSKMRGLVPRMTSLKPGQSRRHVSMLRKRPSRS